MIIAVDIDEVIAQWWPTFAQFVAGKTRRHLSEFTPPLVWSFWEQWGITEQEFYTLFAEFGERGYYAHCQPYEGAAQGLAKLREDGFRVILATARGTERVSTPEFRHRVQSDTLNWLKRHCMTFDDVCFLKEKSLLRARVLIDDAVHNLTAAQQAGMQAIAFDQSHNKEWQFARVAHWRELPGYLHALRNKL